MKKITILIAALIMVSYGYSQSKKAVGYSTKGNEQFNQKDYGGAIESYTKAINIDPKFAMAYSNRGHAKLQLEQYDESIFDFNQAIALLPNIAQAYNGRGLAKYYLQQYIEAIKDFDQSIIIDPKYANCYVGRGLAKSSLKQFEDAIKDFDQAISLDPKDADIYNNRGLAKNNLGHYEEAIKDYDHAIRIDSKNTTAYYYSGFAKRTLAQFEEAIKDFDQAIIINPKFAMAYFHRGLIKRNLGHYEEAINDFNMAIAIDPKNLGVYYQLGKCYYKLNNAVKANEYLSKYLLFDNKSDVSCFANVYLGQKDIAFSKMEELVRKTPSNANYYQLASVYAVAGETENAIKNLDSALSKGYNTYSYMQNDENLEFIRYKPGYIDLIKKYNIVNTNANTALSKVITSEVKAAILRWQEKGEFETNTAYTYRMKTRDVQVNRATLEVTNQLKKEVLQKVNWDIAKIGKYDSEGQTFIISFEGINSIVVKVPLADAPAFKSNFQTYNITHKDLVVSNEQWVISEFVCADPTGTKSYKYDIKNQPDYNPNQIFSLNFDALNIKLDQYVGDQSQKQTASKTIIIGKDPVDIDIPVNNATNSTTFALIIGNESYKNEIAVPFALNDATVFSEYCIKTLGLPTNNVHIVKDATYGQMLGEIKWLQDVLKAYNGKAKVIFYYAGHGMPDEKDKSAYLLPTDGSSGIPATAVKVDELYSGLSGIPNAGVLVFLDACFSGAAREGALAQGRGVKIKPKENILKENIVVFSATSGEETAMPLKERGHGLFTYYLLKKLQESKGDINLLELTEYVSNEVKQQSIVVNNKSQNPKVNMSSDMMSKWQSIKIK